MDRPTPVTCHMSHDTLVTLITHHTFGLRDGVTRARSAVRPRCRARNASGTGFGGEGAPGADTRTDSWELAR